MHTPHFSSSREYVSLPARTHGEPSPLGLALVNVAGGDRALLDALRGVAWTTYQEADCPFGPDEQGMEHWWAEQLKLEIE